MDKRIVHFEGQLLLHQVVIKRTISNYQKAIHFVTT